MIEENKTGCRYITVDAYYSAVEFYLDNNFQVMTGEDEKRWKRSKLEVEEKKRYNKKHNIDTEVEWPQETLSMWFDLTSIS